jgi:hypothetical protein
MEINPHLSNEQVAELLTNSRSPMGSHAEHCDACLNEVTDLRETARELREGLEEPQAFWDAQQRAIRARIYSEQPHRTARSPRLSWALAVITIVVAFLFLSVEPAPPPAEKARIDPDHELLLEVERALQTGGPEALAPASLLVRDISQYSNSSPSTMYKETTHAN